MEKVLLAINHPATEEAIKKSIQQTHICVGVSTYREAVIPTLKETGAEIVLIREELAGSMKLSALLKNIRVGCPKVRIIFMCQERDRTDPFLTLLVQLGIYDIINSNAVNINTMVSYIMAPRTFRDVSSYFRLEDEIDLTPLESDDEADESKAASGGLFGILGTPKKGSGKKGGKKASTIGDTSRKSSTDMDVAAMRAAIQEEADRKARANLDEMVAEASANANKQLQATLNKAEETTTRLRTELQNKTQQAEAISMELDRVRIERDSLQRELEDTKQQLRSSALPGSKQIISGNMQELVDKISQMERKVEELQNKVFEKDKRIAELEDQLGSLGKDTPVIAGTAQKRKSPLFSALKPVMKPTQKDRQVIAFVGSKHGSGNTTVALNLAAYLAVTGYNVLFMEINSRFPLINHYFNFSNVINGIDTACQNINNGAAGIQPSIIQPRLIAAAPALAKRYGKLPETLHFMTFSNEYLRNEKMGKKTMPLAKTWMDLMYILGSHLGYSYIIVDLQPDDQPYLDIFMKDQVADRLMMTFIQDTHSLASSVVLTKDIVETGNQTLAKSMGFVLNEFDPTHKLNGERIGKWLGIDPGLIQPVSLDKPGYSKAEMSAIPYVLSTGEHVLDYQSMVEKFSL